MTSDVRHFLELLWAMTEKELRARYKYTMLGFFWLIINPILQMLIIGFVFTFFMKEPIHNYYYYLFTGLLIWNFFSLSLTKATTCIVYNRALIKKASFPRAVIPLSIILSNLFHLVLAQLLFLIPILFLKTFSLASLLPITIAYLLLILFTVGISLLTCSLNVRFRDVNFSVQALLIIWFYATPIVYSFLIIPRHYIWLWRINPMTSILQLFQYGFIKYPMPGAAMLTINITLILATFALGLWVFQKESDNFDDWV